MTITAWVYVLRLESGGLYVGSTVDLSRKFSEHFSGRGSRTTCLDLPVGIVYAEEFASVESAMKRESQLKVWSRAKKEALIRGDIAELKRLAKRRAK